MTHEEIAEHTAAFLAAGGVIQIIPFLHTTIPGHPDVAQYIRMQRYGNYMRGVATRVVSGREPVILSDAVTNQFANGGRTSDE